MDCCPLMVSELPVVCSRIDGVVTVVKAEQPGSASYRHLYWGESSSASIAFVIELKSVAERSQSGLAVDLFERPPGSP